VLALRFEAQTITDRMTLEIYRTRVFREAVHVGMVLFARSIKPLEGSRS
jgi:hypothetical protein